MNNTKITPKNSLLVLLFVFFLVFLSFLDIDKWLILSVGVWGIMLFVCLRNASRNIFFLFFLISFFIYLISGDVAELIFDRHYHLQFSSEAVSHAHKCIFISLVSIGFGYIVTSSPKNDDELDLLKEEPMTSNVVEKIKTVSKMLYGLTFVILIINTIDTVHFVATHGYIAYYTSFVPMLPSIIVEIGEFAPIALSVFLATFPTKEEASGVIKSYLLYAILTLFIGSRGGLVYNVIFILCYCFYRNYTDRGRAVWVSKKITTALLLSVPFLLSFLYLYEYIRTGRDIEFSSFGESIVDFFVNIGASSKVIKYGYEYADKIPKWRFYSLGETLNYFKYGTLFNLFDLGSIPPRHSAEFALESHSLDTLISYLSMENQFLGGHGTGSSFVATLYADFGYIGVAIGGAAYGWLFKKMSYLNYNSWLSSSVKLYIFMALLEAPRGSFDGFLACIVNINYLIFMVFIYMLAVGVRRSSK